MEVIADGTYEQVGTFNGNPLTMAAAKAMLLEVLTPAAYRHLDELRERADGTGPPHLGRHHLPGYVSAYGAKGAIVFSPVRIRDYRDFCRYDARYGHAHWLYQHNGGVFLPPWGKMEQWTLSVQHTADDVDRVVANLERFAQDLRACTTCVPSIHDVLGQVGLPAPIAELARPSVGRRRRRRWPQRPGVRRLPRQGRPVGARARTPRAARRGVHPRAAVRRPGLRRQPVRVRRRAARSAGHRRARAPPPRVQGVRRRPGDLVPVRRRHVVRAVPRPRPHRRRHARERLLRGRHQGPVRVRGLLRPDAPGTARAASGTRGSATRPTRRSCASCSATTRSWSTRCSRRRSPTSSTVTSTTLACSRRCTGRA